MGYIAEERQSLSGSPWYANSLEGENIINITTCFSKMSIGLFGQQAIPTILTVAVWWPIAICQVAGLVKQYKMDQEVLTSIVHGFNVAAGHTVSYTVIN